MTWRRAVALLAGCTVALLLFEAVAQHRYRDTVYVPGPDIERIQAELVEVPDIGFLWRAGVRPEDRVIIGWSDAGEEPLSADRDGFRNGPPAVARLASGEPVQVVGLGDSFMHGAAVLLHDAFAAAGHSYHSRAMHRHCPPQYNLILKRYALPLAPAVVLYGISENDYTDIDDFERWQRSGSPYLASSSP